MSVLELRNVSVGYGATHCLEQVSLTLDKQEIVCLLGPNGCGKTTLLKAVLGLLKPQSGAILVDGKPLPDWTRAALAQRIAYVPQAHLGAFPFTVEQIVLMGRTMHLRWHASPGQKDRTIALQALERLGISHLRQRNYMQLSGGERQLTMIARALAQQTQALVLDEPTSSLDFGNQLRVLAHIRQLRDAGYLILLTMHQPDQVLRVADRVVLLHERRVLAAGDVDHIMTAQRLGQIYGLSAQDVLDHLPGLGRRNTFATAALAAGGVSQPIREPMIRGSEP
uniref:ABC transporter ATP-binding protein n=1 Tax=Castellaniella defragrans TaxID=75697 RepID=UPI00334299F6